MPVNILYCEGGKNSPDIRVLTNILSGVCIIKPARSKYGLDRQILFIRQEKLLPNSIVAALKDRDFDSDDSFPLKFPRNWLARVNSQDIQVGWSWERKEIENYLIDPDVVSHALPSKAPPIEDYRAALKESAKNIANYTAARIALSLSYQEILPPKNCWGEKGINKRHTFPSNNVSEEDCRQGIKNVLSYYKQSQLVQECDVLNHFDQLLSTCCEEGFRFQHFLTFFSGKDLLCGMKDALIQFSLGEPHAFLEQVVKGLENSPEDVSSWIPEWNQLKQVVQNFSP